MTIKIKNNYVGVSPFKLRKVADLIRSKSVKDAVKILRYCDKKEISILLAKMINSGLSMASTNSKYDIDNLRISSIFVNEGPSLKRVMPRAQGRAFQIKKRSSHINMEISE